MKLVADLESDNLYHGATKIWCGVFKCVDTLKVWKFREKEKMFALMDKSTVLIMHNGIGFDVPLMRKIWGYEYKGKVLDTVLLSRELYKNVPVPEQMKIDYAERGKKLDGPHSLAAWGYRLGRGKVEHEDWSAYSPAMMHRCAEDVEITYLVYLEMKKKLANGAFPNCAVWLTMSFMECISRQEKHGWKLDIPRAQGYIRQLSTWVQRIDAVLQPYLPVLPTIREDKINDDDCTLGVQNPFTKAGTMAINLQKWITKNDLDNFGDYVGGPFCRVAFRKVSLASDKEVKEFLLAGGWQPEEYNYSKKEVDEDGNPIRTSPKLSADDSFIGVDGKMGRLICKRVQCVHRRSNIQGWLDRVREDGRLESRVSGFADTYRVRHANIANVPNTESFYGNQMRKCFIAEEGMTLVSVDAASCQDRMLISRARDAGIKDPLFEDMILHGDKKKGTDSHTRARDELNKVFEAEGYALITRGGAKNFNYAYKFNAGDKKLGTMAGVINEGAAKSLGSKLRSALDMVFQAQVKLEEYLKKEWKTTARIRNVKFKKNGREFERTEFYNGRIRGLDGRMILIRNEKDILVFMLQADEALTMQYATVLQNKELRNKYIDGVDFKQVCMYHDETTVEAKPQIAEDIKDIMERAINDAGNHFNLSIEQTGEGAIGSSWQAVH
jgi:DNA polymerase-1